MCASITIEVEYVHTDTHTHRIWSSGLTCIYILSTSTMQELTSTLYLFIPFSGKLWNSLATSVFPPSYHFEVFEEGDVKTPIIWLGVMLSSLYGPSTSMEFFVAYFVALHYSKKFILTWETNILGVIAKKTHQFSFKAFAICCTLKANRMFYSSWICKWCRISSCLFIFKWD